MFFANLWRKLTLPHPSITDIEQRRQSQLLAAFIFTVAVTLTMSAIPVLLSPTRTVDDKQLSALLVFIFVPPMVGMYFLNRNGKYRQSAFLFICELFIVVHITLPVSWYSLGLVFFSGGVILIGSILLTARETARIALASIGIQIFFVLVAPKVTLVPSTAPLFITIAIGGLVAIFHQHRNTVERARRAELEAANAALRESEISLEQRVTERTRDLEIAAEVSKQMTTILDLHKLLANLVEQTRAAFDLYHVSVFVYDAATEILVYEAGTGEAGLRMKAAGKHFHLHNQHGLVPLAARTKQHVLVNDVSTNPSHLANPDLPQTHAELVLPMVIGAELIGVLDLQSERVNRFSTDDLKVLTSLAEQLAVAVRNARYYGEQVEIAERLRAVDTIKSQFLASMSHELRTPLNAVLNFTEFVGMGMLGPVNEKQQDALTKALDSGRHLLALINDVLDMTKIEAGMLKLFVEADIDLTQELSAVIAATKVLLNDKSVEFVQDIDTDLPLVVGDRRRIRQVLLNLLSNAAKFTEEGSIKLSVRKREDEMLFCVLDTGPGIAQEDQADIFEPFKQTETGIRHAGGTGLGLPISKRLVEAHGGKLWVESKPGEGAAFYCTFPIRAAELVDAMKLTVSA